MAASLTVSRLNSSQVLRASQSTGPDAAAAREILVERFGKLLKKITAQTCRRFHLSDQERDEVLAETYHLLLNPEIARFVPRRGDPAHYFRGLVQNAARKTLTQVGRRKRKSQWSDAVDGKLETPIDIGDNTVSGSYRALSEPPLPGTETELRDMIDYVMRKAPPHLRRALELCYWEDWPIQSIARDFGVSRFSLARELHAFLGQMQAELGCE